MKSRLKAAKRIFENVPFEEIERKYIGRAVNFQPSAWRMVYSEPGSVYWYYESIDNEIKRRLTSEGIRKVFLATDANVFSDRGVIYNSYYHCTVLETLETWGSDTNLSTEFLKITQRVSSDLKGLTVSLLSLGSANNYAHFLFDSISKLKIVDKITTQADWYLVSGPETLWKKKIVTSLGISDKVVWVSERDELRCEQLLFTNRINSTRHISPFAARAIRDCFLGSMKNGLHASKVIYASRKNSAVRGTPIEDLLQSILPAHAQVVDFEGLSMDETIRVCQECDTFVGIHGAAFSNIVFCQPNLRVIEIQVDGILHELNQNYYHNVCEYLGFSHRVIRLAPGTEPAEVKRILDESLAHRSVI